MSRTNLSNNNIEIPSSLTLNEVYEKARPLQSTTKAISKDQAHGDDAHSEASEESEKALALSSPQISRLPEQQASIPAISSSSNEFSLEMATRVTDTSNEALKTDDENGMTRPYSLLTYDPKVQDIILSDVSMREQRLANDECEYEIDLGNGWITKSISSYQPENRQQQQQRTKSILSADSSQPISTFQIPFTGTFYQPHLPSMHIHRVEDQKQSSVLFHSQSYAQRWPRLSLRTGVSLIGLGATMSVVMIVLIFLIL